MCDTLKKKEKKTEKEKRSAKRKQSPVERMEGWMMGRSTHNHGTFIVAMAPDHHLDAWTLVCMSGSGHHLGLESLAGGTDVQCCPAHSSMDSTKH